MNWALIACAMASAASSVMARTDFNVDYRECPCCFRMTHIEQGFIKKKYIAKDLRVCTFCYKKHKRIIVREPHKFRAKMRLRQVTRELTRSDVAGAITYYNV